MRRPLTSPPKSTEPEPCWPSRKLSGKVEPFELLARRCRRMADAVSATSRRRDVRRRRSQILLALFDVRCPPRSLPRKKWYVPGAAARVGAEGIQAAWTGLWGEDPPSLKTIRGHLGALEMACCLARSPGDWLPMMRNPEHPERRPRYPDTFHLIESHEAAQWWSMVGRKRILESPDCRFSPTRWWELFGSWRVEAAEWSAQGELFPQCDPEPVDAVTVGAQTTGAKRPRGIPNKPKPATPEALELAATLRPAALKLAPTPFELHGALRQAGVHLRGKMSWALSDDERVQGAMAMLAVALVRGDRIRSLEGWLVRAYEHSGRDEQLTARRSLVQWNPKP